MRQEKELLDQFQRQEEEQEENIKRAFEAHQEDLRRQQIGCAFITLLSYRVL